MRRAAAGIDTTSFYRRKDAKNCCPLPKYLQRGTVRKVRRAVGGVEFGVARGFCSYNEDLYNGLYKGEEL